MNIIAISGSLRKDSFNTALLRAFRAIAPADMQIEITPIDALPFFNEDLEASVPDAVLSFKEAIATADGVIIATPEYNRSIPGVLKNAIDWASRPYGKNSFAKKAVLISGVSIGNIGTAVAQSHLRQIMVTLDTFLIGQPELYLGPAQKIFDEVGAIADESTKTLLKNALKALSDRVALTLK